jgi:hypothetical protein
MGDIIGWLLLLVRNGIPVGPPASLPSKTPLLVE